MSNQDRAPSTSLPSQLERGSLQQAILRMQTLLGERIERTHEMLSHTKEGLSQLQASQVKIAELESELQTAQKAAKDSESQFHKLEVENKALRERITLLENDKQKASKSAKDFESQFHKLEGENKSLRARIVSKENEKQAAELQVSKISESMRRLQEAAALEIGRTVKALLPNVRFGLMKRPSLAEKVALLVDSGIIDADWYLRRHPDVAAAGMDAGVHYILHGAEEGRIPKPGLDEMSGNT